MTALLSAKLVAGFLPKNIGSDNEWTVHFANFGVLYSGGVSGRSFLLANPNRKHKRLSLT